MADSTWSVPPPRLRTDVMAAIGRTRQLPPPESEAPARKSGESGMRRWMLAAAAAVVLAAGTGTTVYAVQDQRVRDQSAVAAGAQVREARIQSILASPDLIVRTSPVRGGGKVTVASSATRNAAVVSLGADRAPASDQAFQMWTIHGTTPTNAEVMAAGQGAAVAIVEGLPGSDALAVTLEPAGGSTTPTQPLYAKVSLT